jgi:hypothetical protein
VHLEQDAVGDLIGSELHPPTGFISLAHYNPSDSGIRQGLIGVLDGDVDVRRPNGALTSEDRSRYGVDGVEIGTRLKYQPLHLRSERHAEAVEGPEDYLCWGGTRAKARRAKIGKITSADGFGVDVDVVLLVPAEGFEDGVSKRVEGRDVGRGCH